MDRKSHHIADERIVFHLNEQLVVKKNRYEQRIMQQSKQAE